MKIKKLGSATILIETSDTKILCDPWLIDGAYYGALLNFARKPDVYRMDVHTLLNALHI